MTFNRQVLALDLATVTGWALGRPGETPRFGTIKFPNSSRAAMYRYAREWYDAMIDDHVGRVVFESAATPSIMAGKTTADTIKMLVGLTEHLEEICYQRVELREARVADVRIHFIGTNMKRDEAKRATVGRCLECGWGVKTNDEADACALWSYQVCALRPDLAATMSPLFSRARRNVRS